MIRPNSRRGFTLVELLVVMSIIGLLISILVPTIAKATLTVRTAMTRRTLGELTLGLQAYRNDHGQFPPSRAYNTSDPGSGTVPAPTSVIIPPPAPALTGESGRAVSFGAANLACYLLGPARRGWGAGAGGWMPTDRPGAPLKSVNRGQFGPYFLAAPDGIGVDKVAGRDVAYVLDSFQPPGRILYWRADTVQDTTNTGQLSPIYGRFRSGGGSEYGWMDNGRSTDAKNNYYTERMNSQSPPQDYFDEIAKLSAADTPKYDATNKRWVTAKYVRDDYLLVSPGPDGRYGYTRINESTGYVEPCSKSDKGSLMPDDITNWQ